MRITEKSKENNLQNNKAIKQYCITLINEIDLILK